MPAKTEHEFRSPVFVRDDDTVCIAASVVVWRGPMEGQVSVKLASDNASVLINAEDWPTLVRCVTRELSRVE